MTNTNEMLLDERFTSNGVEMRLAVTPSESGFRAEILPMTLAAAELKSHWFRQATGWTRQLAAEAENASIHCYRNESGLVIEALGLRFSNAIDIAGLENMLRSPIGTAVDVPQTTAVGATEMSHGPFLTG